MIRNKILGMICPLLLMSAVTACSVSDATEQERQQSTSESDRIEMQERGKETEPMEIKEPTGENESRTLVVYFSRWGNTEFPENTDANSSASIVAGSDNQRRGTTQYIAEIISASLDTDLHLIQTAEPYPVDYDMTVDQNHQEQDDDYIPELQSVVENFEQYDTIFVGYPIWATTLPQPIVAFFDQNDFSGKTIIPFCTHAGFGSGNSFERIQELNPDAEVKEGYAVETEQVVTAETGIAEWLQRLGLVSAEQEAVSGSENIEIRVGETIIFATLNGSDAAKEFASRMPITVSMTRMGEHEYYGALAQPLVNTSELQTGYAVGDLAFWTPGDLFAVYFDEPENAPEGLMILGRITSDMSVFDTLGNSVEMTIVRLQED